MKLIFLTKSPGQTKKLAKDLAKKIIKINLEKEKTLILALEGDLGGGKTTFLQGFAKGLGIKEKILSPSFIIMRKFSISKERVRQRQDSCFSFTRSNFRLSSSGGDSDIVQFSNFYHFDCYRIKKAKEILSLGFKEIIQDPRNIVAIEWADKVRKILPKDTIWINFWVVDKNKRKIALKIKN